jgi:tetratricopeptide (TPR) repeat protein
MNQSRMLYFVFAGIAFIASFVAYLITVAPTVPFWDGGEFIAASYILGIPHPPGSPLYILLGRLFSELPFGEVAWRVNMSSGLFSALTVVMVYLIVVKAVKIWRGTLDTLADQLAAHCGGLVGALMLAFSDTFWFNAVEAEVYALAMLIMTACTWLTFHWVERFDKPGSERYLLLIGYLAFLGIAVHMFTLLIAPAVFLCAIVTDRREIGTPLTAGLFAVMGLLMGSVVASIDPFFTAIPLTLIGLVALKGRVPWAWFLVGIIASLLLLAIGSAGAGGFNERPIAFGDFVITWGSLLFTFMLVSLALLLVSATSNTPTRYGWNFWASMLVLVTIGYSVNFYVPIRSSQQPAINENNPSNWKNFEGFLERKQYGQESMLVSMFNRKGSLSSQFGDGENIGFWRFFSRQYGSPDFPSWMFPLLLGLFGLMALWRYDKRLAIFMSAIILICSVGLILYMNFSDGSRGIQREVRERDYFFTPAFVYFSILMGLGVVQVLAQIKGWVSDLKLPAVPIISICAVLALAIPYTTYSSNYETHTREGNYIPYDYAYNILQSCDENGILFTNGDNDTFTLWFLQEVKGIRKDVRIVNLSLLNTNWYIHQLKDMEPKVPISLSSDQVERVSLQLWEEQQVDIAGLSWTVPPAGSLPDGRGYIRVQDLMILDILRANNWVRPIFFAVTVSTDNYVGLRDYFQMEGMVFRLTKNEARDQMDLARTHHNLWDVYQYRGIADSTVYKDPQTSNLLRNYSAAFQQMAILHYQAKDYQQAIDEMEKYRSLKITDGVWERSLLTQFYADAGQYETAEDMANELATNFETFDGYIILSDAQRRKGADFTDQAIETLERGVTQHSSYAKGYEQLAKLYFSSNDTAGAIRSLERWQQVAPADSMVGQTLRDLQAVWDQN